MTLIHHSNLFHGTTLCGVSTIHAIAISSDRDKLTCPRCRIGLGMSPDPRWRKVYASIEPYVWEASDARHAPLENMRVLRLEVEYNNIVYTSRILFDKTGLGSLGDKLIEQTFDDMVRMIDNRIDEMEKTNGR